MGMMVHRNPSNSGRFPWRGALSAVLLFAVLALPPARADEIRFRTGDAVQTGTVLEENGGTVTIRFPREAIESIARDAGQGGDATGQGQAPGLEDRVRVLEKKLESLPAASSGSPSLEDVGGVEGVIRWKDRPLARGRVMIVPAKYAGRPPAPGPKAHPGIAGSTPGGGKDALHETETDAAGRYRFERIPVGEYLLYWMPDGRTGWVRRMRDTADLEVVPGGVTVLNIPEERK
jgi:hypothetical protein